MNKEHVYLHDKAKIKVYDQQQDKNRTLTFTVKDNWGFIDDKHGNMITEMQLENDKFDIINLKRMFMDQTYPVRFDQEKPAITSGHENESNRDFEWVYDDDRNRYVELMTDHDLSSRYDLRDVIENNKSIYKQAAYHFVDLPQVNEPTHLKNDVTGQISGPIIPTTTKALNDLVRNVYEGCMDVNVSQDSTLKFAGKVPSCTLVNGSVLDVQKGANVVDARLDHSQIVCQHGQIINSTFKDSKNFYSDKPSVSNVLYVYNSTFDHAHLIAENTVSSSVIDYAALNQARVQGSSLKGGNYQDSRIKKSNTWLPAHSIVRNSTLNNTRLENRKISNKDYQAVFDQLATTGDDMYANIKEPNAVMISDSTLDNVQMLSNGNIGSTLSNTQMKNVFVKEWLIANDSKLIAVRPTRPLLIGKTSLDDNDMQFTNYAVSFNLDEYSSPEAQNGLELPKGAGYDDINIGSEEHAVKLNPNAKSMKKLTKLERGHYVLNNGDDAFTNLTKVLGDDGGKHLAIKHDRALDGLEP